MSLEKLRTYVRITILYFFFALLFYVVIRYTGTGQDDIKPMTIFSFVSGVIVSKLIEFYVQDKK